MMLLLWVVLLIVFLWMFFPMGQGSTFKKYEKLVHPYSGLDPESWSRFLNNIRTFQQLVSTPKLDSAANALYAAMENIRDLGLSIRRADDAHHQEDLDKIAMDLGYDGEFIINQNAIANGLQFFPKYLNETPIESPDDGKPVPRLRSDM